eukprot:2678563-Amphidinium_carterae.3
MNCHFRNEVEALQQRIKDGDKVRHRAEEVVRQEASTVSALEAKVSLTTESHAHGEDLTWDFPCFLRTQIRRGAIANRTFLQMS